MTPAQLQAAIATHYTLDDIRVTGALAGGEWNHVLRVETGRGPFVLRVSHPATLPESVAYEHALMRFMHRRLPQVPDPVPARDGSTYFVDEGRVVCLFPWMPGEIADRESAAIRAGAGRMLARIHRASLEYPDRSPHPVYSALRDLDWDANLWWSWREVRDYLSPRAERSTPAILEDAPGTGRVTRGEIAVRFPWIEAERERLRAFVARLAGSGRPLPFAPVHGDYYRRNLLAEGDRITAVIDWEECHPDWLVLELAQSLWELCKCDARDTLHGDRAAAFLRAYGD